MLFAGDETDEPTDQYLRRNAARAVLIEIQIE